MTSTSRVAIITGASGGIGRQVAITFLQAGYRTAIAGRRKAALDETLELAGCPDDQGLAVACDVSDVAAVDRLFDQTVAKFGRLDVLFNNAGTNTPAMTPDEITPEQWQMVVNVNLTGVFLCTRRAFAIMRNQQPMGGRIINNGSISAHVPRPGSAPYTATKHAVSGLTKTTALDGRPFDIACCQIDIGNAATDMTERMSTGVPQADGSMAAEPTMDAQHVADAVLHMASLPSDVVVQTMTIMAAKMPFVGRG